MVPKVVFDARGSGVSDEPSRAFQDQGILQLKEFFTTSETEPWRAAYPSLKHQINEGSLTGDYEVLRAAGPEMTRKDRFIYGFIPPPIGAIYAHPKLKALATRHFGPNVALYMNRLLLKDEAWSGSVGTHQDAPYFNGGHNKLSAFVPLTDQSTATGGLIFYCGSHRYGNLGAPADILVDQFPPLPRFEPELEVGDVLLSSFFTWHYSEAPKQRAERALLQIVYQPASDGSYEGGTMPGPTLVAGEWKTEFFVRNRHGVAV